MGIVNISEVCLRISLWSGIYHCSVLFLCVYVTFIVLCCLCAFSMSAVVAALYCCSALDSSMITRTVISATSH